MAANKIGNRGERIAARYLRAKGYRVIAANYRVRGGEIDLICRQGKTLVFVEVKTRSNLAGGWPEEAITRRKMERLQIAIENYLQARRALRLIRIDVISIVIADQWLPTISHFHNVTPEDLTRTS